MWVDQGGDRSEIAAKVSFSLAKTKSIGPGDLLPVIDEEDQRRAWARSSLGRNKSLGRSYSCSLHQSREKLALPVSVLTKKKSERLDYKYSNVGFDQVDVHDPEPEFIEDELEVRDLDGLEGDIPSAAGKEDQLEGCLGTDQGLPLWVVSLSRGYSYNYYSGLLLPVDLLPSCFCP